MPIHTILGPTCSGKTAVALALAERMDAEIVSCDSMQVYRELNAGTAKPTLEERRRVPHHLVDILSMSERFDAGRFCRLATAAIHDIQDRAHVAILAGGTGLYAKALVYQLPLLPSDDEVFADVLKRAGGPDGLEALAAEVAAHKADAVPGLRENPRRLMRAVEVLRLTGHLPDEIHRPEISDVPDPAFRQVILMPEPQSHKAAIQRRTREMVNHGWIEEVRALMRQGLFSTPTARQALGYRDVARFIEEQADPEARPLEHLAEDIATRTWQFARRQRTWFRHQHPGATILPVDQTTSAEALAKTILSNADAA